MWTEFLDYFAGVSLAIEDDDFFELTMRNAIKVRADRPPLLMSVFVICGICTVLCID